MIYTMMLAGLALTR